MSAAGCRLIFHIRTKERRRALGLSGTTTRPGGHPLFSDEIAPSTMPIEFQVFTGNEGVGSSYWESSAYRYRPSESRADGILDEQSAEKAQHTSRVGDFSEAV
jgi:hypothetical protein